MTRELKGLEEGPKAEIHIDFLKTTLKNIKLENALPWRKTWIWAQEIHLDSPQTSDRNEQIPTRSTSARMDDQRKDYIDSKGPKQRNRTKQLQTLNLPTDYGESINSTKQRSKEVFFKEMHTHRYYS